MRPSVFTGIPFRADGDVSGFLQVEGEGWVAVHTMQHMAHSIPHRTLSGWFRTGSQFTVIVEGVSGSNDDTTYMGEHLLIDWHGDGLPTVTPDPDTIDSVVLGLDPYCANGLFDPGKLSVGVDGQIVRPALLNHVSAVSPASFGGTEGVLGGAQLAAYRFSDQFPSAVNVVRASMAERSCIQLQLAEPTDIATVNDLALAAVTLFAAVSGCGADGALRDLWVTVPVPAEPSIRRCEWWSRSLLNVPMRPPHLNAAPIALGQVLDLSQLGGLDGVLRWMRFCLDNEHVLGVVRDNVTGANPHPRAVITAAASGWEHLYHEKAEREFYKPMWLDVQTWVGGDVRVLDLLQLGWVTNNRIKHRKLGKSASVALDENDRAGEEALARFMHMALLACSLKTAGLIDAARAVANELEVADSDGEMNGPAGSRLLALHNQYS